MTNPPPGSACKVDTVVVCRPLLAAARERADREVRAGHEPSHEGRLAGPGRPDEGGDPAAQGCGEPIQSGAGEGARLEHAIADPAIGVQLRSVRDLGEQIDLVQDEGGGEVEVLASDEVAIDDAPGGRRPQRGHHEEQVHVGRDEPVPAGRPRTGEHRPAFVHRFDDALVRSDGTHRHPVAHHERAETTPGLAEAHRPPIVANLEPAPPAGGHEAVGPHSLPAFVACPKNLRAWTPRRRVTAHGPASAA